MKVWCVLENSLHIYIKIVNKLVDDGFETGKAYLSIWSVCLSSEARLVGNQAPLPFPFLSFPFAHHGEKLAAQIHIGHLPSAMKSESCRDVHSPLSPLPASALVGLLNGLLALPHRRLVW